MIKKKDILNDLRKVKNDLNLDIALIYHKIRVEQNTIDMLVERINEIEKYLGVSFTVEVKPEVITKGYKKNKIIKIIKKNK